MTSQAASSDRREPGWVGRDERRRILLKGTARRADGSDVDVTLADMSRDGCRLDCSRETLTIGEWVEISAAGFSPIRGQVRWSLLGSAGVRFEEE